METELLTMATQKNGRSVEYTIRNFETKSY